jgi:hypothetical protein
MNSVFLLWDGNYTTELSDASGLKLELGYFGCARYAMVAF